MWLQTGLLDDEESKRKPIAVSPPAGNAFKVSWLDGFISCQWHSHYTCTFAILKFSNAIA